ncbi:SynChlorMet cassette protein ScmD [Gammaproteobacteria bacterium]
MNKTDKPIANPIVVLREESDDWAILFNPDTADAIVVNPVGVAVWRMMDGKKHFKEIVLEIRSCFENASGAIFEEIFSFIEKLAERGYVGYEFDGRATEG